MKLVFLRFVLIFSFLLQQSLWAQENYYAGLIGNLNSYSSKQIKIALNRITSLYHLQHTNGHDSLHRQINPKLRMFGHKALGYNRARDIVYNRLARLQLDDSSIKFKPVHCNQFYTVDIPWGETIRRALVAEGFNIEHLWPRSTFHSSGQPHLHPEYNFMLTDLHHLRIAEAVVNTTRKSYPFAEVIPASKIINRSYLKELNKMAGDSKLGTDIDSMNPSQLYFEPAKTSKGPIARSMMYFSIRYEIPIDPIQEYYFRKWHRQYKVTPNERAQNEINFTEQRNRNPFIDYPELEGLIDSFRNY